METMRHRDYYNQGQAMFPIIVVESPLRATLEASTDRNLALARNICRKIALQGMNPIASHLYFTLFLNDNIEEERKLGIEMGLQNARRANAHQAWFVVREESKILSTGMLHALSRHTSEMRHIRYFTTKDNGLTLDEVQSL